MANPIDRAALREKARRASRPTDVTCHEPARLDCSGCEDAAEENTIAARARFDLGDAGPTVTALLDALDAAEREADRWRHGVPIEGDYVCPTSLALDQARADFIRYAAHESACASHVGAMTEWAGESACDCGYAEARARAEGR